MPSLASEQLKHLPNSEISFQLNKARLTRVGDAGEPRGSIGDLPRSNVAAELVERSMHVIWLILPLRPYDDRSRDHVKITYHVYDRSQGEHLSKMAGLEWVIWHDQTLELADRPERDFASVANSYYDQLEAVAAFWPGYMLIDYGDLLRTRYRRAAAWRPADGGLVLRVSRQGFCDAVVEAWTGGD